MIIKSEHVAMKLVNVKEEEKKKKSSCSKKQNKNKLSFKLGERKKKQKTHT